MSGRSALALGAGAAGFGIGAAFGFGAAGLSIGFAAGGILGGFLFPPSGSETTRVGPRLDSRKVTSAHYGAIIPKGFGTVGRVGGIMEWADDLIEEETTETEETQAPGKGGGPTSSVTTTTYNYFASFVLSYGLGPAASILKTRGDAKIIYDISGTDIVLKPGTEFRFYPGDGTHVPDPMIEAKEGVGRVPGYQEKVLQAFELLPIADYGNRIPNITSDIAYSDQEIRLLVEHTPIANTLFNSVQVQSSTVDWDRRRAYWTSADGPNGGIRRFSTVTLEENYQLAAEDIFDGGNGIFDNQAMHVMPDGSIIATTSLNPVTERFVSRLHPETLQETGRTMNTNQVGFDIAHVTVEALIGQLHFAVIAFFGGGLMVCGPIPEMDIVLYTTSTLETFGDPNIGAVRGIVSTAASPDVEARAYMTVSQSALTLAGIATPVHIYEVEVEVNLLGESPDAELSRRHTINPGDIVAGETLIIRIGHGLVYDRTDGNFIMQVTFVGERHYVFKVDNSTGQVLWATEVATGGESARISESLIINNTYGYFVGRNGGQIDTTTGELLFNFRTPDWDRPVFSEHGAYNSLTEAFITTTDNGPAGYYFNRRQGGGTNLDEIIRWTCNQSGIPDSQLDLGTLSTVFIQGYLIAEQITGARVIDSLSKIYPFSVTESGFTLVFRLHNEAVSRSFTRNDAILSQGGEAFSYNRVQDEELVEITSITYADPELDYQTSTQSTRRIIDPTPAGFSRNKQNESTSLVLSASAAKQITEVRMATAWNERTTAQFQVDWEHIDLDPGDNISIREGGIERVSRVEKLMWGANLEVRLETIQLGEGQTQNNIAGVVGRGSRVNRLRTPNPIQFYMVDAPLFLDGHDAGRTSANVYFWAGGFEEGSFRGAVIEQSLDGTTYLPVQNIGRSMTWGVTFGTFPDPIDSPFLQAPDQSFTVRMVVGGASLASITQDQLLAGRNSALIIKENGEHEVIQFRTVTMNANGSYTLSDLVRGRRGTDTMAYGHLIGETFILLDRLERTTVPLSQIGSTFYMRASGGSVVTRAIEFRGRSLYPYAPSGIQINPAGGGDLDISWIRRDRISAPFGTTAPLNEDSEAYTVDIYNDTGTTIVRTVSAHPASPYTYTAADQAADGVTLPGNTLTVRIRQESAQVGPGFGRPQTINIGF